MVYKNTLLICKRRTEHKSFLNVFFFVRSHLGVCVLLAFDVDFKYAVFFTRVLFEYN